MYRQIIADPAKQKLFIPRIFVAPIDMVYKAFSDTEEMECGLESKFQNLGEFLKSEYEA